MDVSKDPNDPYVLLIDSNGTLIRRTYRGDQANPDYQRLTTQASQAQAAMTPNGNLATGGAGASGALGMPLAGGRGPGG